ncbi:MAG: DUF1223 domain-containing protein [Sulfitobacter sp.]
MKRLLITAAAMASLWMMPLAAQERPVVVELFTSQGCMSCPPVDAIFGQLAGRKDVIAIALHVDYWDYIGWKDTFGVPAHADRQRAYAAQAGRRTIFTPQIIVQGQSDIVGAAQATQELQETIASYGEMPSPVQISAARSGAQVVIKAQAAQGQALPAKMSVYMLRLIPRASQKIERGENRGETFDYTNIAFDMEKLGDWDGRQALALQADAAGEAPVVVLIQQGAAGPILGAARLD